MENVGELYVPPLAGKNWEYVPADFKEFPERDIVNYPHPNKLEFPSKTRLHIIPDSWFRFLYPVTGETGGYFAIAGVLIFLFQKEWYVIEQDMHKLALVGFSWYWYYQLFGGKVSSFFNDTNRDGQREGFWMRFHFFKLDNIEYLKAKPKAEEEHMEVLKSIGTNLPAVQRENLTLQLEAEYRKRLQNVHNAIKRRLDFFVEYESTRRRFEQKHMVDWIMQQVRASVTPQMEAATLKQCIVDLKAMANKAK
jgi:F-type H+-transporting ATPase subunit b